MDEIFKKFRNFVCVYIDDVMVHSRPKEEHVGHLKLVQSELLKEGIIINSKKGKSFRSNIEFLGVEIGNGKIKLQPHFSKKILETPLIRSIKTL